jgi:hypothetical protein
MRSVRFESLVYAIDRSIVLRLPEAASKSLPSRSQVAVGGTINGHAFETVLEPDGSSGHWMRIDAALQRRVGIAPGDVATLDFETIKKWPEPLVPDVLQRALIDAPQNIRDLWRDITPTARWEWARWVNATRNPATRQRRVEVTLSKMNSGKRRPCCFNLSACTDPDLSRNGRLVDPQ